MYTSDLCVILKELTSQESAQQEIFKTKFLETCLLNKHGRKLHEVFYTTIGDGDITARYERCLQTGIKDPY